MSSKVTCDTCGGEGIIRFGDACPRCGGSGRISLGGSIGDDITYEPESVLDSYPEVRIGNGGFGRVQVPNNRPICIVLDASSELSLGTNYFFEIKFMGLVLTYRSVPVEEHDIFPDQIIVRLDKATSVEAHRV